MSISVIVAYPLHPSLGVTHDPLSSFYTRAAYMCQVRMEWRIHLWNFTLV